MQGRAIAAQVQGAVATLSPTSGNALAIRTGDLIEVSIVSSAVEGFIDFSSGSLSPFAVTGLPPQEVRRDGRIRIPRIGTVRARGFTPQQLEARLTALLSEVLVEPSVFVRLVDRRGARATVLGSVTNPGSVPILRDDLRLLDLIGEAGGPNDNVETLQARVTRDGETTTFPLVAVFSDPSTADFHVQSGDTVVIEPVERRVVVRGAVTRPGRFTFTQTTYTLSDALGSAAGLGNRRASRKGVFVYRALPLAEISAMGFETAGLSADPAPVIFQFDYRLATTPHVAREFEIRDGDVVFVTDNFIEELNKILGIVTSTVPPTIFIPTPGGD
ncbi:MAG: polysaccharide biosynthesis/export family protein [Pseudomonadota bacterium]